MTTDTPAGSDAWTGILIRRMEYGDIDAVAAIGREIFSEPWTERGFEYAIDVSENVFLVAESPDGRITGYCGLYALADEGEIVSVAVVESLRGKGIGRAMMEELLRLAVRQGVERIFLEVRASNEAAISLYRREGFLPCGTRSDFYRYPTEDALLMSCETGRL